MGNNVSMLITEQHIDFLARRKFALAKRLGSPAINQNAVHGLINCQPGVCISRYKNHHYSNAMQTIASQHKRFSNNEWYSKLREYSNGSNQYTVVASRILKRLNIK